MLNIGTVECKLVQIFNTFILITCNFCVIVFNYKHNSSNLKHETRPNALNVNWLTFYQCCPILFTLRSSQQHTTTEEAAWSSNGKLYCCSAVRKRQRATAGFDRAKELEVLLARRSSKGPWAWVSCTGSWTHRRTIFWAVWRAARRV